MAEVGAAIHDRQGVRELFDSVPDSVADAPMPSWSISPLPDCLSHFCTNLHNRDVSPLAAGVSDEYGAEETPYMGSIRWPGGYDT